VTTVTVVTGGELHPWPGPTPDFTFNLSRLLHDPAHIPTGVMLDKTGLDEEVAAFVFDSDEALELLDAAIDLLLTPAKPMLVAWRLSQRSRRSRSTKVTWPDPPVLR
jgi:hypothetical protein